MMSGKFPRPRPQCWVAVCWSRVTRARLPLLPTSRMSKDLKAAEERATQLVGGQLFQAEGTCTCLADIEELV